MAWKYFYRSASASLCLVFPLIVLGLHNKLKQENICVAHMHISKPTHMITGKNSKEEMGKKPPLTCRTV
ncbi:hypothetical protein XELAEV_18010055mg [Xenopus laevis]|uniref:Uncharacterized protein n=1 Tax=Xenopus laevis TaxID=8355 RepID=A0A974DTT7_XENLA|nr:hypothetical protein XELAEV_18010055mg [Xenopus laevis]